MTGVVLITRDSAFGRHMSVRMAAALAAGRDPLIGILLLSEPQAQKVRPARSPWADRVRRLLSSQARQNHQVWRLQQQANAAFAAGAGPTPDWPSGVVRHTVLAAQVNEPDTIAWLRSCAPRLVAVAGAPVLSADLLAVPSAGTLNMHSSVLPRYRGTRAEFWQVHNDDLDCVGITIHFVDTRVDGGDIIRHHRQKPAPGDSPWLMRARNQMNGLTVYPETLCAVLEGDATCQPQPPVSERAYRYSDITPEATRRVLQKLRQARTQDIAPRRAGGKG